MILRLPPAEYAIYAQLHAELLAYSPSLIDTVWITIDRFGMLHEHNDDLFDDEGFWYCYGISTPFKTIPLPDGGPVPDSVWPLLRRSVA